MASTDSPAVIDRIDLAQLFSILKQDGYQLIGPKIQADAIVYDEIETPLDLPIGWIDEQEGGIDRLKRRNDHAVFGYHVGSHSWKKYLFQPQHRLWQADDLQSVFDHRQGESINMLLDRPEPAKRALIGVRACELAAIKIQDQVFLQGEVIDPHYQANRQQLFIMAVNCGQTENTCFCTSMNTGPAATQGYDLALTEVLSQHRHYFVVSVGSDAGLAVLQQMPHEPATEFEQQTAQVIIANTAQTMGRTMNAANLKEQLYQNLEHSRIC
jgi:sulfhydrogenase subunit beta (sulfur reductase)